MITTPPLPAETIAALAKLHDIHLPEAIGWWPLAPGWWLLLALAVLAIAVGVFAEARRRHGLRHLALIELRDLRNLFDSQADPVAIGITLAVLLRRVALSVRQGAAALNGDAWVAALTTGRAALSPPIASFIANAPYAPKAGSRAVLAQALCEAERWIRGQA